jgi:hypothetical protein
MEAMEGIKNKTNCPNCGAALPQFGGKCEFCGTRVVDLTAIDFDCADPTMFILRMPKTRVGGKDILINMWARPELNAITMEAAEVTLSGGYNEKLARFTTDVQVAFEMSLRPYADPNDKSLFKMQELTIE